MTALTYLLNEVNWKTIKEAEYEVVILPWGATEAHNYHLPYATDNIHTEYVAAGNPAGATKEKGTKYLKETIEKIADFLIELAESDIDKLYV
jgi:creatinine amidohydrolase